MADIDIDLENGAAKVCNKCDSRINDEELNSQLDSLRNLDATDFYICHNCVSVIENACVRCHGTVFIPTSLEESNETPDYCPQCRNDLLEETGNDPGWQEN